MGPILFLAVHLFRTVQLLPAAFRDFLLRVTAALVLVILRRVELGAEGKYRLVGQWSAGMYSSLA